MIGQTRTLARFGIALTTHLVKTLYALVVGGVALAVPAPAYWGRLRLPRVLPGRPAAAGVADDHVFRSVNRADREVHRPEFLDEVIESVLELSENQKALLAVVEETLLPQKRV